MSGPENGRMDSDAEQFIRFALEREALKFGWFDRQEKGEGETSSVEDDGEGIRAADD